MTRQGDNKLPNLETNLIYLFPNMKKSLPLEVELALVWQEGLDQVDSL